MRLFTETLQQFLDNRGGDFSPSVNVLWAQIPKFRYTTSEGVLIEFSLKEMFIHDNRYREIGAETEELFEYYLETRLDEVIVEYVPKIDIYLKNFGAELINRKISVSRAENKSGSKSDTTDSTSKSKDTAYINPVTNSALDRLQVSDVNSNEGSANDKREGSYDETITVTEDRLYSVFGKTNTQLLEEVMQLKNIYLEALDRLANLFMYVV